MVRRILIAASLAIASVAHAETFQDPAGHFSIDVESDGLCVAIPVPPEPCFEGDARALTQQALAGTPGATLVCAATRLDAMEVVAVLSNGRASEVEIDHDEIAETARELARVARKNAGVRSASSMTVSEHRVNGVQTVTYSGVMDVAMADGSTTAVTVEQTALYGRRATCWILMVADSAHLDDARVRVTRALPTIHLEPAFPRRETFRSWWWLLLGGLIGVEIGRRWRNRKRATRAR